MAQRLLDSEILPAHLRGLTGEALRAALHSDRKQRTAAINGRSFTRSIAPKKPEPKPQAPAVQVPKAPTVETWCGSPLAGGRTFATFLGSGSELARALCKNVASGFARCNPATITGPSGFGKTHLLEATAHGWKEADVAGAYVTAEDFLYGGHIDDILALRAVAIDDVHLITSTKGMADLRRVLEVFIGRGKPVVMGMSTEPGHGAIHPSLLSRITGGIVVEVDAPDTVTRWAIFDTVVAHHQATDPDLVMPEDVGTFVAGAVNGSARDVISAANRLIGHHYLTGRAIDMKMAENALRDLLRARESKKPKIEEVQQVVCQHFNVSREDLVSARRTKVIVRPRQIAMYLAKTLTPRSLPEIGRRFGHRDHTTVLHAVRKVEDLITKDEQMAEDVKVLKGILL